LCFDIKFFDELFPAEFAGYTAPNGYLWKVIYDPTRNGEDPGLFYGSLFRLLDILPTKDEVSPWPERIVFEHIQTGQRLSFIEGQPVYLNLPEEIVKRRLRNRKNKSIHNFQTAQVYMHSAIGIRCE